MAIYEKLKRKCPLVTQSLLHYPYGCVEIYFRFQLEIIKND